MPNHAQSHNNTISHDPATHIPEQHHQIKQSPPRIPIIILATLGIILVATGLVWYFNGQSFDFNKEPTADVSYAPVDETIIATVGAENIYANDLKYKLSFYPESMHDQLRDGFKQQLFEESIVLQAGADQGYIDLTSEVFNSVYKNYDKRNQLLKTVESSVNNVASSIKGAYVTIWFMNDVPGPIGYEAGKQVALEKITALHQAVSSGEMTIEQAGEKITRDVALEQLDSQYKVNAYNTFESREAPIGLTFSSEFNQALLTLEAGQTTQVFTIQDYENRKFNEPKKDAFYMFGQVTERNSESGISFDKWVRAQKEKYAVIEI